MRPRRLLVPVALLLWLSLPASAQEGQSPGTAGPKAASGDAAPAAPAPGEAAAGDEPRAIPASRIPRLAEEAARTQRSIRGLLEQGPAVPGFEAEMDAVRGTIQGVRDATAEQEAAGFSLRAAGDLRNTTSRALDRLAGWAGTLEERAAALEKGRSTLRRQLATWSLTLDSADEQGLPEPLRQRVRGLLEDGRAVRAAVEERLTTVLVALDGIAAERIAAQDILARLRSVEERLQRSLLEVDNAPLWRVRQLPRARRPTVGQLREAGASIVTAWRQFRDDYGGRIPYHAALSAAILGLMLRLRRRSRRWEADGKDRDLEAALHAVSHPYGSTLLLSAVLVIWFYPAAPVQLLRILVVVILLPLVRLLGHLAPAEFRSPLRRLTVLFLLQVLVNLLGEGSLLRRMAMLGLSLAAVAVLALAFRPGTPAAAGRGWRGVVAQAGRLAAVGLAAAVLANVAGNLSLADLLASGIMGSSFLALVLLSANLILRGMAARLLAGSAARRLRVVRLHGPLLRRRLFRALDLGTAFLWASVTVALLGLGAGFLEAAGAFLAREWAIGSIHVSLGGIILFAAVVWLSVLLSRFLRFVLDEEVMPALSVPLGVGSATSMLVHYAILALGSLLALSAAGIEWNRVALLLGALGVGIGFGLQGLVNNFVSGLILVFERPIKVGDVVEVGALLGQVRSIGIRASVVRTFDGAEVIVPNGNLLAAEVTNWTLSDRQRRVEILVGVAYGTDPRRVQDSIGAVLAGDNRIQKHPEPMVLFQGFGDSSLDFRVLFWTADIDGWLRLRSDVAVAVNDALREAGIEIPFPQRDLHLRTISPQARDGLGARAGAPPEGSPAAD